jgi:hypothetical protein
MSVNRSVAAAQRRRAAPPDPVQLRGPNTSINSAQLFANQSKPGSGPNIPVGKLAGQQAQQNMSRQYEQQAASNAAVGIESLSKMTLPQAITLITLRLGKVESMLQSQTMQNETMRTGMHFETDGDNEGDADMVQLNANMLQSILTRLESLEKRNAASSAAGASSPEIILLKQQFETIKPILTQTKSSTNAIVKEHKDFKSQFDALRNDLEETKELVIALQNLTMDNSQKILAFDMSNDHVLDGFDQSLNDIEDEHVVTDEPAITDEVVTDGDAVTDLKEMVKQEFNLTA